MKALRIALLALAGLLLVLTALAGWLLGTESGARALVPWLLARSGASIAVEGIEGRLADRIGARQVIVETDGRRIELRDLHLHWHPRALLAHRLHIESLRAAHLTVIERIDQPRDTDGGGMPDTLALPIDVRLDELQLEGGTLQRGPVPLATLGPLALGLTYADNKYTLALHRFGGRPELDNGSARATVSGKLELAAQQPYALQGHFALKSRAQLEERALGADGTLALDGSLAELRAALDLRVNGEAATGRAVLRPFSEQPLAGAELRARALDLAAIDAALPRTRLDIALDAAADGNGTLHLNNGMPGTLSAKRIPLQSFAAVFRQQEDGIAFPTIEAHFGSAAGARHTAGAVTGHGSYHAGTLELTLRTERLDLQRIDPQLRATRLAGSAELRHAEGRQSFSIALSEPLDRTRLALSASGVLADTELEIDTLALRAGAGSLLASGRVSLEGKQAFRADGELSRFDLHAFGDFAQVPRMNLNGSFTLQGERSPELQADLQFRIADSRLAGEPLHGGGTLHLRGARLEVPELTLASGPNRVQAKGRLADGDARLDFSVAAPELGRFGPTFGGAFSAEGTVRGTLEQPDIQFAWQAKGLHAPGEIRIGSTQGRADLRLDRRTPLMFTHAEATLEADDLQRMQQRIERLDARLRLAPQPDAPLALDIDARGVALADTLLNQVHIEADGSNASHRVRARIEESGQQWTAQAAGGLHDLDGAPRWEGELQALNGAGRIDLRTQGAAPLLLSAERMRMADLRLAVEGGQIEVDFVERTPQGLASSGRLSRFQVGQWLERSPAGTRIDTDLQLSGAWDLRLHDTLDGTVTLQRDGGDVTVLGATPVALGLNTLRAAVRAQDGALTLDLQTQGQRLGRIALAAATRLGRAGNPLALADRAPLSGSAELDVPSLAWVAALADPALTADGRLQGKVALGGSIASPVISGRLTGDALRVVHAEIGLDLRNGILRSEFNGDRLHLQALSFEGAQGRVRLSGPIDLGAAPRADLHLVAEKFAALNRPDRRLVLSGESRLDWHERQAQVTGEFQVDSGFFDIGTSDAPRLSDDVIVVGEEPSAAKGLPLAVNVLVRLGDGIAIEGRGLSALIGGRLRIVSPAGEPLQAEGTLRVVKGTFSAYGRELAIEQGRLRFTGPLNNPALDIVAMRRGLEVEAGVSVGGNVLSPRVTLVSEPAVPDAEKLSWLVLGRSLSSAGPTDVGSLQTAAASLLTQGAAAGVQSRIASAFGLDTFSVGETNNGNLAERIVTVGKQISSRLYLGYQHGLESAASVVQLRYLLTPRLSVEAEAGARSALSLFYNIAFD